MGYTSHESLHRKANSTESVAQISLASMVGWLSGFQLLSLIIFLGNLGTIVTFKINRRLRRRSMYCLINLAIADSLHGFICIFWYLLFLPHLGHVVIIDGVYITDSGLNLGIGLANTTTMMISLLSLLLVSLDRMSATCFPFFHRKIASAVYYRVFVALWIAAFVIALVPCFTFTWDIYGHDEWFKHGGKYVCIISQVVIVVSYAAVFLKIRYQNKQHRGSRVETANAVSQKKERDLAVTLFIVTILSLATWMPFVFLHEDMHVENPTLAQLSNMFVVEFIQLTNSFINPVVYIFRMKDFRQTFFRWLIKCWRRSVPVLPSNEPSRRTGDESLPQSAVQSRCHLASVSTSELPPVNVPSTRMIDPKPWTDQKNLFKTFRINLNNCC